MPMSKLLKKLTKKLLSSGILIKIMSLKSRDSRQKKCSRKLMRHSLCSVILRRDKLMTREPILKT